MPASLGPVENSHFNLELTLQSGQVFHAMPTPKGWQILFGDHLLELEAREGEWRLKRGELNKARHFFALDHDLEAIVRSFPTDDYTQAALRSCQGMRILRQEPWECLATFLASPMKRVEHIRAISLVLRKRYGRPVPGSLIPAFPTPSTLACLEESDLRACGLGFRAKNVLAAARRIAEGAADLEGLRNLPTAQLREVLCAFPGVGRKIANCVLLFAYERLETVPVDTWIQKIATRLLGHRAPPEALESFAGKRFGPCAGYVQQYLFHLARTTGKLPVT